ncbi:MAG: NAD(P)H-dependent oxidoreductase [Phycisphaerae bacterium]|nr:NAD(P)H-dependent oxidoreductase [Phycisphaerae bacterium]
MHSPPDHVVRQLRWRYATKKFDASREIPADQWHAIEHSLVLAPSSFGLQPWKFIVVRDRALREKLRASSWNQAQVTDASHLVVIARRSPLTRDDVSRHLEEVSKLRGIPLESLSGYRSMIENFLEQPGFNRDEWTARQAYVALGFLLATCAQLGVDACPMEGFDAKAYDDALELPAQRLRATVVAAVGFRDANDPASKASKVRFQNEHLVEMR